MFEPEEADEAGDADEDQQRDHQRLLSEDESD